MKSTRPPNYTCKKWISVFKSLKCTFLSNGSCCPLLLPLLPSGCPGDVLCGVLSTCRVPAAGQAKGCLLSGVSPERGCWEAAKRRRPPRVTLRTTPSSGCKPYIHIQTSSEDETHEGVLIHSLNRPKSLSFFFLFVFVLHFVPFFFVIEPRRGG